MSLYHPTGSEGAERTAAGCVLLTGCLIVLATGLAKVALVVGALRWLFS